jgi:hypothetical protein
MAIALWRVCVAREIFIIASERLECPTVFAIRYCKELN